MRILILLILLFPFSAQSQQAINRDSTFIREAFRQSYTSYRAYEWLTTLCKDVGHRLSGSPQAAKAVEWAKATMDTFGLDRVWLQPVMVPHWVRGESEQVIMFGTQTGAQTLMATALGNSPGTGPDGIRANVIEVKSLDELNALPDEKVIGKIVYFSREMDLGQLSTMSMYGGAVDQRSRGPIAAAKKGAIGVVIRSVGTRMDDFPHTGMMQLSDTSANIPAFALSTNDAVRLSKALSIEPVQLYLRSTCKMMDDVLSYNVIGELKGTESPDTIILVGGHLDSWDKGEGAHDDGSGCVQSMEVLYRLAKNGYKPKHTIRCVLFMNEENGLRGGRAYADSAALKNEHYLAAIESDSGGGTAQNFGCSAGEGYSTDQQMAFFSQYSDMLKPYDLDFTSGGGGADIGPLRNRTGTMIALRPDNSRYFDYHHSDFDILENVHPRELASGAAAMVSLVYLLDQYGIGK